MLASLAASACGSGASHVAPTATSGPTLAVAATIHLGAPTNGSHPTPDGLWFSIPYPNTFYEIDPATNAVVATVAGPAGMGEFFFAEGSLWVGLDGAIARLDPGTGRVLATIPIAGLRNDGARMAADATSLWVGNTYDNTLARIDLKTNQLLKVIPIDALPTSVAVADGSVWVCAHHSFHAQPAVWRIDPATYQTVAKIDTTEGLGYQCGAVTADPNGVIWVGTVQELRNEWGLLRIDPATNRIVAMAAINDRWSGIVADPKSVWVVDLDRSAIVRYEARSDQLVSLSGQLAVGGASNQEIAGLLWEANGALWVQSLTSANTGQPGPTVWRLSIIG
jgi:streptogramin lyase